MHDRFRGILAASALSLGIATALGAAPAHAQAEQARATYGFDLPAQPLADSLRAIARQTGANVLFESKDVEGVAAPALRTTATASEAIERVLAGTGLSARRTAPGTVVIRRSAPSRAENVHSSAPAGGDAQDERMAEPEPLPDGTSPGGLSQASPGATTMDAMVVTGTRIRGGSTPSPVIAIGAERIQEEGFTDLGEVIRSIPQNFSGGQNPGVVTATGSGNNYNQNATGGAGLNLRGLGADATLTLLNGRRLPNTGFGQAVDISAIPIDAVERIDIVMDGASAIYGSDAVAGVGNVVLKREFDGVTLGARYGGATDGGLDSREYTVVAGTTWASGGLLATYKDAATDPIFARQRHYSRYMDDPFALYPQGDVRSGLISAHQALGERVELQLDAFRTERGQTWYQNFGAAQYINENDTTTSSVAPGVEVALNGGWTLTAGAAWGRDRSVARTYRVDWGSGSRLLGVHGCFCNDSESFDLGMEGPLFLLPGGEARLAVGAGRRKSDYTNMSYLRDSREEGSQASRHAYAELNLPLVAPEMGVAGVERLSVSAAVRGEDYDSFGGVTTPKLGLIYSPSADFSFKASWGKSFKAPMLSQLYAERVTALWMASDIGASGYPADATVLMAFGGNPDLQPERARTLSTSLAFHPTALPGLEAELTWFRIDYDQRVVQPLALYNQALSNPALADFIHYAPDATALQSLLSTYGDAFYDYAGVAYDPDKVVAIAYAQYANATEQRIKGVDLSGSYRLDAGQGSVTLRGSASWLESEQRSTANQAPFDLAGMIFYPAKLNARAGAVWSTGGLTTSVFANYVAGVTDTTTGDKTASFTTFDATARYVIDAQGPWSGLEVSISGQNLFNRAPPLYAYGALTNAPYDSTNYSAIGRFVSVAVAKHW
ncbi:TonB-dependent receptor [Luteimonas sp. Y-2-2-4F]|nr:TonB-dependent receptor [Luteimonas sp. Y-2-2-4F]MCD9033164.1 TonB-dependent receptor [Luteimonas sp. Y-2-2-4F]